MIISIVVAIGSHREIGLNNKLLWHLPEDLKLFKQLTMGHHILLGRKTFESIGRVLPGRKMIVVTRNQKYVVDGAMVVGSVDEGIVLAKSAGEKELFVVGGSEIYGETLKFADRLYVTFVDYEGEADAYFPDFEEFFSFHASLNKGECFRQELWFRH